MGRPELAGDFDEGLEASIEVVGGALAPEGDEGGEDWGIPNVLAYIEEHLKSYLVLTAEIPKRSEPSAAHLRGFAQGLRDLAEALDDLAEDVQRDDAYPPGPTETQPDTETRMATAPQAGDGAEVV